jgi:hypothetical protein
MRRKLTTLGAMLALVVSFSVMGASPADAASFNPYAAWSCGATRPHEEYTLTRVTVLSIGVYSNNVSWLRASCFARAENRICNWISESRSNGVHFVYSGYSCATVPG